MNTKLLLAAGLLTAVVSTGAAYAIAKTDQTGGCIAADCRTAGMSMLQIVTGLEAKGYSAIIEVELEDGRYEVEARDADGRAVELEADCRTGEILSSKFDDD